MIIRKKEVLIFPLLCFFTSIAATKDNLSILFQIIVLILASLGLYIQNKSEKNFNFTKFAPFFVLVCGSLLFFFFKISFLKFLIYILILLTLIKFFSQITSRDIWQIYALSFALMCLSSIWNFNILIGILIIIFTWFSITGLCLLKAYERNQNLKEKRVLFYFSTFLTVIVILISVIFFVFLPRSPYAFFSPFGLSKSAKTGFTEEIELKKIKEIRENKDIAFRAIIFAPNRPSNLYWRGIVYDTYKDGHWYRTLKGKKPNFQKIKCENFLKQIIFLEPYEGKTLFALNFPLKIKVLEPKNWRFTVAKDMCFESLNPVNIRLAYEAYSCKGIDIEEDKEHFKKYLQVPKELRVPLKTFLKEHKVYGSPDEVAEKIKKILLTPPYLYVSKVKESKKDPVIQFLFFTHLGWCEHFASASALLLREAGIPARLIGGYLGGIWNDKGKYYIVKQKEAHTWVEYFNGKKWIVLDPTPQSFFKEKRERLSYIEKWLDFLRIKWYMYVISYDYSKQQRFFRYLKDKFKFPRIKDVKLNLKDVKFSYRNFKKILIGLFVFILFFFLILKRRRKPNPPEILRRILKKYGYLSKRSDGLIEIGKRIYEKDKVLGEKVLDFAENWYEVKFGEARREATIFINRLKDIKKYLKQKRLRWPPIFGQVKKFTINTGGVHHGKEEVHSPIQGKGSL